MDTNEDLIKYLDSSPFFVDLENESRISRRRFFNDFQKLPESLKDLLVSTKTADLIFSLSKEFSLNNENMRIVAELIRYVVVGNVYIKYIPDLLASGLSISQENARDITGRIINQLFSPVLEDIKKIQIEKFGKKTAEPAPTPAPVTPSNINNPNNTVDLRNK
ncbi:MAG: hypothetical protein HYT63_01930 [Candidatus Yanofskybacteria bacterium]|nr:hypothetical protein [Candidatus Yanofskybacteria bacterium]